MNKNITYDEVIESCNNNDTTLFLYNMFKDVSTLEEEIMSQYNFQCLTRIKKTLKGFQVDLVFDSPNAEDFGLLFKMIEDFGNPDNEYLKSDIELPFTNLLIFPKEYNNEYHFLCLDAMHITYIPEKAGELANIIRIYFDSDDVLLINDEEGFVAEPEITEKEEEKIEKKVEEKKPIKKRRVAEEEDCDF